MINEKDWPARNFKKRRYHELSTNDKINIVYSVLVEKQS